ncbi:11627_t:CDS:2 [Ambispora leptoticha]|uniref:11627_t:CDS:1 n=1 Tax=Ambispora leptoticha TaxID=144679 RepID=A0A9N9A8Q1_9GLOM|nr:11627_t:CDS:2 [Ambispora leptoticha]
MSTEKARTINEQKYPNPAATSTDIPSKKSDEIDEVVPKSKSNDPNHNSLNENLRQKTNTPSQQSSTKPKGLSAFEAGARSAVPELADSHPKDIGKTKGIGNTKDHPVDETKNVFGHLKAS